MVLQDHLVHLDHQVLQVLVERQVLQELRAAQVLQVKAEIVTKIVKIQALI